jgi:hypothetical protein
MATDIGFEILVDSGQTEQKNTEIVDLVYSALARYTKTPTYAAAYSAGSTSTNAVTIHVGGTSPDFGIRVTLDKAVIVDYPAVLRLLLGALQRETLTLACNATLYTAGDRAYEVSIALS